MELDMAMALTAYGCPLTAVSSFKCLGRVLLASDDDRTEEIQNLWRVLQKWAQLSRVLGQVVIDACNARILYTTVFQVVLLYRPETWVVSPRIGKTMVVFHYQVITDTDGLDSAVEHERDMDIL